MTAEHMSDITALLSISLFINQIGMLYLPGAIAIARAGMALAGGDVSATEIYARQALDLAPHDDHLTRGGAAGFLGLAAWTNGDLEAAHRTYAAGMASLQKAGNIADVINGAITLGALPIAQGRLHEAMRTYEWALQLANAQAAPLLRGMVDIYHEQPYREFYS